MFPILFCFSPPPAPLFVAGICSFFSPLPAPPSFLFFFFIPRFRPFRFFIVFSVSVSFFRKKSRAVRAQVMADRPRRTCGVPERFLARVRDEDLRRPSVGDVLEIVSGAAAGSFFVRLYGEKECVGSLRFEMVDRAVGGRRARHRAEYPSEAYRVSHCKVVDVSQVPEDVSSVIFRILDDPPVDGLNFRTEFSRCRTGPPGQLFRCLGGGVALNLAPCPFPGARSLHDILYDNEQLPALSLDSGHRQYRALVAWGVEAETSTSCIIYGSVESALASDKKRACPSMSAENVMLYIKTHAIPAGKRRGFLRGCGGMLPTIPAGESYHPILLSGGFRFPSVCSYLGTTASLSDCFAAAYLSIFSFRKRTLSCMALNVFSDSSVSSMVSFVSHSSISRRRCFIHGIKVSVVRILNSPLTCKKCSRLYSLYSPCWSWKQYFGGPTTM